MLKSSKLLAGAIAAAAAVLATTGALAADAKGSVYGDVRYGWTYFNDDATITAEDDLGDNGSYFGIKASTTSGDITAFGVYERVLDTDDCLNTQTGNGGSTTSVCTGGTDYTREAFAGVKTAFGAVTYGTYETAYSQLARRYDAFYNTGVSASVGVGVAPGLGTSYGGSFLSTPLLGLAYADNQLTYASPDLFGASVNVTYAASEDAGATDDPDYGAGVDFGWEGVKAGVQHLRIRSDAQGAGTANFQVGSVDATVLSVGYSGGNFGVGLMAERLDDRAAGFPDADTLQLGAWYGVVPGTRVAVTGGMTNEYGTEGRSGTAGVFHDLAENFTVHVAGTWLEGDADSGTPDAEAVTIGASYKFDLGFSNR